jgi:endonuclease-3
MRGKKALIEISNQIFQILEKEMPEPKTELNFKNLYTLLIAVAMSAQTTDEAVNKATKKLFEIADSPEKTLSLGEEGLKEYIKTIGLYNTKAKNVIALSRILIDQYNSEVPLEFEKLISLPGVGRKTANVVLNCWLKLPTMPVDTHVFRVSKRLGIASSNNPDSVERELLENIDQKWLTYAHHWLILHGRYVCKAKKPDCLHCKISQFCQYYKNLS